MTAASHDNRFPNGKVLFQSTAKYDVREVAPGIWRSAAAEIDIHSGDETGKAGRTLISVITVKAVANGEPIPAETFTLAGIGVRAEKIAELEAHATRMQIPPSPDD